MELSSLKNRITTLLGYIKLKYIIIVVLLAVGAEGVWAYQNISVLNKINKPTETVSSPQNRVSNSISLVAPKLQFKIGESIPVYINIKSNKPTIGADIILHYDPNLLAVASSSAQTPVAVGKVYSEYPVNQVDSKNGLITVSGVSNSATGVKVNDTFGTIVFRAKAAGKAKIFLDFTKGKTNDTNLIENKTAKDILEETNNLDITIIK